MKSDNLDKHRFLEILRENLSIFYSQWLMWHKLQKANPRESDGFILLSLNVALRDSCLASITRMWDKGKKNKDAVTFPNLINHADLIVSKENECKISALSHCKTLHSLKDIRNQFVAHSLKAARIEQNDKLPTNEEIQNFFLDTLKLYNSISEQNCGQRIFVKNLDMEIKTWDTLVETLS